MALFNTLYNIKGMAAPHLHKLDYFFYIVRLYRIASYFIVSFRTAPQTLVDDLIAFLSITFYPHRSHQSLACAQSVSILTVDMS